MSSTSRVLLVGWDAADWRVIQPLVDAGKMPAMAHFIENGVIANLATLHPVLSPMLWTSIATGKRPYQHGVLGFTEPTDGGTGIRPVSGLSRKTKAIWNILNQQGLRSSVLGWWPSHPAEPINGVMVSNHFQQAVGPRDEPWPLLQGAVHPPRLSHELGELRFHPDELLAEDILPFIPKLAEIDQEEDQRVGACAKILAEAACVHSAATWLMENEPWDFMAVYYDSIDHFCHGFMKYHPPRRNHIPEREYELYNGVVEAGYIYHDMMLRAMLEQAGDNTTIILVSDHGFHPDHNRPDAIPHEPAGPAIEHRDLGIFGIMGPGVRKDAFVHGVSLLDVTPTILSVYGLPTGEDMDGRVVVECFEGDRGVQTIPSWDEVEGDTGAHPEDSKLDPLESQEAVEQLVALGYIDKPDENIQITVDKTVAELRFNLARAYMDGDRHADAVEILAELNEGFPSEYRFGVQLAMCYRALERIPELRAVVEGLTEQRKKDMHDARTGLRELKDKIAARRAEQSSTEGGESSEPAERAAKEQVETEDLVTENEKQEWRRLSSLVVFPQAAVDYLAGFAHAAEGDYEKALELLTRAEGSTMTGPGLKVQIGETYLEMKRWEEAEESFRQAIAVDPLNPYAYVGLTQSYLPRRQNKLAAEAALEAIGLHYHHPMAHFYLGVALHRMGRIDRAVEALQVAVSLNPNFQQAHLRLARIYEQRIGDPDKADMHRILAAKVHEAVLPEDMSYPTQEEQDAYLAPPSTTERPIRPSANTVEGEFVTVVSGLPRSGTSMMMRILETGGIEVLSDGVRSADDDNPRGYFEFEPAKRTRKDPAWLEGATGKAVKMVHLLLQELPINRKYKIIMMHRDLDEVLVSQKKMLDRQKREGGKLDANAMKETFTKQINRVKNYVNRRSCFELIEMDYNALLEDPKPHLERLARALDLKKPVDDLAQAIDPKLYRNRAEKLAK